MDIPGGVDFWGFTCIYGIEKNMGITETSLSCLCMRLGFLIASV